MFLAFFGLVVDASVIFSNRSMALKLVQDANRRLAIGRFETIEETEQFILDSLQNTSPTAQVVTEVDTSTGVITTRLAMPADEIDAIGLFGLLTGFNVGVQAQHIVEY